MEYTSTKTDSPGGAQKAGINFRSLQNYERGHKKLASASGFTVTNTRPQAGGSAVVAKLQPSSITKESSIASPSGRFSNPICCTG